MSLPPSRQDETARPRVGLFVTCLVDVFRPSVGFAAVQLLEDAGCDVLVPSGQTCCGQPAYNSGDPGSAAALARQTIAAFEACDYVVAPSGSCAGMLKVHYPRLLAGDAVWRERARIFASRVHELVGFLTRVRGVTAVRARWPATAAYHDSCSALRELGLRAEPRALLASVEGLQLREPQERDACCGFGGTFSVKYPEISNAIVEKKTAAIAATGADLLISADMGCLLNMAGKLKRQGSTIEVRHVAEVLAGQQTAVPGIGEVS